MLDFNEAGPQERDNVHTLPFAPNAAAMHAMAHALFRNAMSGLIELSWTAEAAPHKLNSARMFDITQVDELVDYAVSLNQTPNRNVYISAGLRAETIARDRRAMDSDVIAVSAIKADFDTPGSYEAAMRKLIDRGILPNQIVITGRIPHIRAHAWFVLDEPMHDLLVAREIESRLAKWLGGDTSIVNPSRVMRLGGSVAWPLKAGRKLEMTELVTEGMRKVTWGHDELKRVVRDAVPIDAPSTAPPNPFDFNHARRQTDTDLADMITSSARPGEWHRNVLRAIGHMIARGTPPDIIVDLLSPHVMQAGYTLDQTRREVAVMIEGAIRKGFAPDSEKKEDASKPETHGLTGQWIDQLSYVYEPEIIEDLLPAHGVGVVFGPSSAGKSFVVIDWAIEIASGGKVLDLHTMPSGVLYFAAEGYYGLKKRLVATRSARNLDDVELPFNVLSALLDLSKAEAKDIHRLCAYAKEIGEEMRLRGAPLRVVFIDTLAATAPGANENAGEDMGPIMQAFHRMSQELGVVVVLVAHTGKDETRGIRGWSGIRANIDFAIECQVERDADTRKITRRSLFLEKVKDGPDGFILTDYDLSIIELGKKISGKPDTTCRVRYIPPQLGPTPEEIAREREEREKLAADDLRAQVLGAVVKVSSDRWQSLKTTVEAIRSAGITKPGRDTVRGYLRTLISDDPEGLRVHVWNGHRIEFQSTPRRSQVDVDVRVIRNAE